MAKISFKSNVFGSTSRYKIREEIISSLESSKEFRAEVRRVFQAANRRLQNIDKAGVVSPAALDLSKGDTLSGRKFARFALSGRDWNEIKTDYARAVAFLKQPTSTASGARQYSEHLKRHYNLSDEEFNYIMKRKAGQLSSIRDIDFVDRYLMRYKDFTGELEQAAADVSQQIESEAMSIQRSIDEQINRTANAVGNLLDSIESELNNLF